MNNRDRIGAVAEQYTEPKLLSGIEWLVEHKGRELSRGQSGYANVHSGQPIPEDAIYRIFSMTKPIVSIMALILIERGELHLYDTVQQFNPAFKRMRVVHADGRLVEVDRPITVEDLLTHRAGFSYEFITGCHIAPLYLDHEIFTDGMVSLDTMMEKLASLPLAHQPGTQFRYSVATDVLAHVIERATGKQIDELLKEHILDPLQMHSTAFHVPESARDRIMPMFGIADASKYMPIEPRSQSLELADVSRWYPSDQPGTFRRGGHGLFSTINDYIRFARMLLDGKSPDGRPILSRKMLEMMCCNRIPADQLPLRIGMVTLPGYGFGLGVRVMMNRGEAMVLSGAGEFGWAGAAQTFFWVDPHEEMVGVVMAQNLTPFLPIGDDIRTAAYSMIE